MTLSKTKVRSCGRFAHSSLSCVVDIAYGTGLLAFDEVCKRVEALALRTEDDTKTAYLQSQVPSALVSTSFADDAERCWCIAHTDRRPT